MTDPPTAGDLRTRITAALLAGTPWRLTETTADGIAESLMPVITAAVTEATAALAAELAAARITAARREAWDEGFVAAMCKWAPRPAPEYETARQAWATLARNHADNPYGAAGAGPATPTHEFKAWEPGTGNDRCAATWDEPRPPIYPPPVEVLCNFPADHPIHGAAGADPA